MNFQNHSQNPKLTNSGLVYIRCNPGCLMIMSVPIFKNKNLPVLLFTNEENMFKSVLPTQNDNLLLNFIMLFNKNILQKNVTILLRLFAHYTKSGLSSNE